MFFTRYLLMTTGLNLPEEFIEKLPDPKGARRFVQRLHQESPEAAERMAREPSLMANLLILAAHSPYLAETMLQQPATIDWLSRDRDLTRLKSKEALFEDLGRFVAIRSDLNEASQLSRFKRREWLRIYLRDCLGLAALTETTLELSNLADVLLQHALWHARQVLVNQYGTPETNDDRGRIKPAEFSILALGKLGSQELNYASDIDLFYLYSQNGATSTGQLSNKEFFIKLAEQITQIVGDTGDDGAVYRIDLRLRPYGRAGDIAVSLEEALNYYRGVAHHWERQALIRARGVAGDAHLANSFLSSIRDQIYTPEPLPDLLEEIRTIKDKIDRESHRKRRGLNVKLGSGGIREIEFIVQALQLYFGGREPWVRTGQVLIGLQRLSDKGILTDADRARLFEAYTFLRTVEHRLQMEHGLRTHVVPTDQERLDLLARRLGYSDTDSPSRLLLVDLKKHTDHVAEVFESLFRRGEDERARRLAVPRDDQEWKHAQLKAALEQLASAFDASRDSIETLPILVPTALARTPNPERARKNLIAFAQSLTHLCAEDHWSTPAGRVPDHLFSDTVERLIRFFGVSQFFSQILIAHPSLVLQLPHSRGEVPVKTSLEYLERFRAALSGVPDDLSTRMDTLRRVWHEELLHIGYLDITGGITLAQTNSLQTALARASLQVGCELALEQVEAKFGPLSNDPRYVILGLGRLGHNGMDYGSDLDLIVVYDDEPGSPVAFHQIEEVYTLLVERVVHILSAITREGSLYSVDLRLRPEGSSGPLAQSGSAFINYLSRRAATWEHLAYLKAYPVVGDPSFAMMIHRQIQSTLLNAHRHRQAELAQEVLEMRRRLEREKAKGTGRRDFMYGIGGMLDVYFATRFLQLKHQIPDPPARGTLHIIDHLLDQGVIDQEQHRALFDGYAFLRWTDHSLRLLFDRPKQVVPANHEHLLSLARQFGSESISAWQQEYEDHTKRIRRVFEQLVVAT